MKEFKGIWIPYEVLVDKNLNDKEKMIYSMILYLSKENDCTMSNTYISNLLNICNVQASRIINSLKKKGYINVQIICLDRDYSDFNWNSLYANNLLFQLFIKQ